jgi:hypothetical protein
MRKWPGVHEAAVFAAKMNGISDTGPEYPYYDTRFDDFLASCAKRMHHEGRPNAWWRRIKNGMQSGAQEASDSEALTLTEKPEMAGLLSGHSGFEREWVMAMRGLVDVADVWDVWTLVRMLQCESAAQRMDQDSGTENNFMRLTLPQVRVCPEWQTRC